MFKEFSFIHTSDLHLDSPFQGLCRLDPQLGKICIRSTFEAYNNIINQAIDRNVDFVLIAGDSFDRTNKSLAAQREFFKGLEKLDKAGIKTFMTHGNHDPSGDRKSVFKEPVSTKIFSSNNTESVEVLNSQNEVIAIIHGLSFKHKIFNENPINSFPQQKDDYFNIGLLHCNVGSNSEHDNYAPCSIVDLKNTGYDYWALGHIHKPQIINDDNSTIIYCGTPQGRSSKEINEHGCYLVKVDNNGKIEREFITTDIIRWQNLVIDISSAEDMNSLATLIEQGIDGLSEINSDIEALLVNLTLIGDNILHKELTNKDDVLNFVTQSLSTTHKIYIQKLEIKSRMPIDVESLKSSENFIAYLLNLMEDGTINQEVFNKVYEELKPALSGYYSKDNMNPKEILDEVQNRCLELFYED